MTEPSVDPRELPEFLRDKAVVDGVLASAREIATSKPFRDRREAGQGADVIKELNSARRVAEKNKLEITAPWRASTNAVNAQYKELLAPLSAAEQALKDKAVAFQHEEAARVAEELRQREEERHRKAEEAAQEAQEAAELAAEDDDPEVQALAADTRQAAAAAAVAPPPRIAEPPKQLRGGVGTLGTRKVWRVTVTDPEAVPSHFKIIDQGALKAAVNDEARAAKREEREFSLEIPGTRIFSEDRAVSR